MPDRAPDQLPTRRDALRTMLLATAGLALGCDRRPRRFERSAYTPPDEGVIYRRRVFAANEQTVLYIPHRHYLPTQDGAAADPLTMQVQRDVFRILVALREAHGAFPVVMEGWPQGRGTKDHIRMLQDAAARDPATFAQSPYTHYLSVWNAPDRRKAAEALLGRAPVLGAELFATVWPEDVTVLGAFTMEEELQSLRRAQLFQEAGTLLSEPAQIPCADGSSLADAVVAFRAGRATAEGAACICRVRTMIGDIVDDFAHERHVVAPAREIAAAAQVDGLVVVEAGTMHLHGAIAEMERRRMNHIVVLPRSIADDPHEVARLDEAPEISLPEYLEASASACVSNR